MSDNPGDRLRQMFDPERDLTAAEQAVLADLAGIGVDVVPVQRQLMAHSPHTPVGEEMLMAVRDGGQDFPANPLQIGRRPYADLEHDTQITFRRFEARQSALPLLLVSQPFTAWRVNEARQLESAALMRYAAVALPERPDEAGAIRSVAWGHDAMPPQTITVSGQLRDVDLVAEQSYELPAAASDQGRALIDAIYGDQPTQVETFNDGRIAALMSMAFVAHPEAMIMNGQANAARRCVALVTERFRALGLDQEVNASLRLTQAVVSAAVAAAEAGRPAEIDRCVFDALRTQFGPAAKYGVAALEHGSLQMLSGPDLDDPTGTYMSYEFTYADASGHQYRLPPYSIPIDQL